MLGELDGLRATAGAEFIQNAAGVRLHRIFADKQALRHLAGAEALGDQVQDLEFPWGDAERVDLGLDRLEVSGTAVSILEQVDRAAANSANAGVAQYAVSETGTLAFIAGQNGGGESLSALALVGLDGRVERLPCPPQSYIHPRVSPDGQRVAVGIEDGQNANVWVYQTAGGGAPRRLTFGGRNQFPIWSSDGRYIAYQSDREKDFAVFRQLADGSGAAERLTKPEIGDRHEPESWRPDGKALSLNLIKNSDQGVWEAPVDARAGLRPIAADPRAVEKHSTFSPDGRWIAYMENPDRETGVYVEPYPPTGAKYQVPMTQTRTPAWSADGKRLFFHTTATNQLWMVDVQTEPGVTFGTPVALPIEGTIHPLQQRNYDVMPDGKRLLVVLPAEDAATSKARGTIQIGVVLDWFDDLKARVRPK